MISYTLLNNGYVVKREENTSITFDNLALELWADYEIWLSEGNTPTLEKEDPYIPQGAASE
jgi:hypothetical protein